MSGSANYPAQLSEFGERQRQRVQARDHLIREHGWRPLAIDAACNTVFDVVDLHEGEHKTRAALLEHSHVG
jgi:hypothetical protein